MRANWFVFSKQMRVAAKQGKERVNFCLGRFPELNLIVGLFSRKKVKGIDFIEFSINTVNAADSLHHASRIPREIIVYDYIGTVQVYTFRQYFSADENAKIVFGKSCFGIKVFNNLLPDQGTGPACKTKHFIWEFGINIFSEILGCFS